MDEVTPRDGPRPGASIRTAVILLMVLLGGPAFNQQQAFRAEGSQPSEYEVKAAFLLNFTKFMEWPRNDSLPADAPFTVCVLGGDPFGPILDQTLRGELVNGRKIVIERVIQVQPSCAILFVARTEKSTASVVAEAGAGVLTIGEADDFLKQGGMIKFAVENRRIRFDVNQRAVAGASLLISSRLLNVARTVEK